MLKDEDDRAMMIGEIDECGALLGKCRSGSADRGVIGER
jgi:hypothetical protein